MRAFPGGGRQQPATKSVLTAIPIRRGLLEDRRDRLIVARDGAHDSDRVAILEARESAADPLDREAEALGNIAARQWQDERVRRAVQRALRYLDQEGADLLQRRRPPEDE